MTPPDAAEPPRSLAVVFPAEGRNKLPPGDPAPAASDEPAAAQEEAATEPPRFDRSMPQPAAIAHAILEGFDLHYRRFRYVAQQAKARFETGDWHGMRASARERIDFYDQRVLDAVARIQRDFDLDCLSDDERDALWRSGSSTWRLLRGTGNPNAPRPFSTRCARSC